MLNLRAGAGVLESKKKSFFQISDVTRKLTVCRVSDVCHYSPQQPSGFCQIVAEGRYVFFLPDRKPSFNSK